ncbi:610_t:CDS:1, partial [Racocetra fulgida]
RIISHIIEKCVPQIGAYEVTLKNKYLETRLAVKFEFVHLLAGLCIPTYQYYLGVKYNFGKGIKKDNKIAAKWFQKAAERGLSPAQHSL